MNAGVSGLKPEKTNISGYRQKQIPTMGPAQINMLSQLIEKLTGGIGGAADYLSKLAGGDEETFQGLEKPAMNAFEKFLGSAGNRYAHLGVLDSNFFENAVSGRGAELAEDLQAQRLGLRNSAVNTLLGQSSQLLNQRPYESHYFKKPESTDWGRLLGMGIGAAAGYDTTRTPYGAMYGSGMGGYIGSGLF